jgi:hypothetical protein
VKLPLAIADTRSSDHGKLRSEEINLRQNRSGMNRESDDRLFPSRDN